MSALADNHLKIDYLAETCMDAFEEVDVYFFIDENQQIHPLFVVFIPNETLFSRFSRLQPFAKFVDTPAGAKVRFPG